MLAMKRKRMWEEQRANLDASQLRLVQMAAALEGAQMNAEVFAVQQQATASLKAIHGSLDIDTVEETTADMEEQLDMSREIAEAISRPMGEMKDMDDVRPTWHLWCRSPYNMQRAP
jgi:charged multivesicular body protein 4